jgi:hypothetical protein
MTPWFERVYQTEPVRESECNIEHKSIELSDDEIVLREDAIREANKASAWRCDLIPPYPASASTGLSETNPMMPEALEMADKIIRKRDAKSKIKTPKGKAKRNDPKLHKAAVESVQEEL